MCELLRIFLSSVGKSKHTSSLQNSHEYICSSNRIGDLLFHYYFIFSSFALAFQWDPKQPRLAVCTGNNKLYMWSPAGCVSVVVPTEGLLFLIWLLVLLWPWLSAFRETETKAITTANLKNGKTFNGEWELTVKTTKLLKAQENARD